MNRTETNNYWNDRFLAVNDKAVMTGMQFYKNTERMFKQAENKIQADMAIWYNRLAINNKVSYQDAIKLLRKDELKEFHWKVEEYIKHGQESNMSQDWKKELENASAKYHITRLESLLFQMREHLNNLYDEYNRGLLDNFGNVYEEAYYRTAYEIDNRIGTGVSLSRLDEKAVDRILNKPWASDGQNFSDRVWRDKTKLINTLQTELTIGLIRGDAQEKIVKRFADKMDTSLTNAGRLIATESAYFASVGSLNSLKELGVKEYEYLATLDIKTSPMCRAMDGKIFKIEDFHPGMTAPPLHCWCRSTIVPKMDDEKGVERVARDPDGNREYVPSTMKYEEWYNKNVVEKTKTNETGSDTYKDIISICKKLKIEYNKPKKLTKTLSTDEIIDRVGGGDKTIGSCSSVAFAYIANRGGLDVLDFRGGESLYTFSLPSIISKIAGFSDVDSYVEKDVSDYVAVGRLFDKMTQDKEYYLTTGCHAAIVRKNGKVPEYLELQSPDNNGYKPLNKKKLRSRFGCQKSHTIVGRKIKASSILIDVDSLAKSAEFKEIIGYINTNKNSQKKGASGNEK